MIGRGLARERGGGPAQTLRRNTPPAPCHPGKGCAMSLDDLTWTTVKSAYPDYGGTVDRGRTGKRVASGAAAGASAGLTGAQIGTGTSALAVGGAVAAGAAVSATGVGLVATAAVLTVGSIVVNARSMIKTISHFENLREIQTHYEANEYNRCTALAATDEMSCDHYTIGSRILPYIIDQKTEKAVKKGVGAAGLGVLTTLYSIGRAAYKSAAGTKGKQRNFYAHVLARHLITHQCPLADAIVTELLSWEEMMILKGKDSDVAGAAIADKMKSV